MHSNIIAIFAAFVALSLGFTIPEDQADGVYQYKLHPDGKETHELIGPIVTEDITPNPSAKLNKRTGIIGDTSTSCGWDYITDADWYASTNSLIANSTPAVRLPGGYHVYAVAGNAWAVCCTNANINSYNWCDGVEYRQARGIIEGHCSSSPSRKQAGKCPSTIRVSDMH